MIRPEWKLCGAAYALLAGVALSGCVTSNHGIAEFATAKARNTQIALTGLMALDTAQTVTIGRSSECLYEANPLAAAVFGSRTPSPQTVLITNTLYIAGHWLLGSYLDRNAERAVDFSIDAGDDVARRKRFSTMRTVYQWLTGIGHGAAVAHNANKGIRPFSTYNCGVMP